MMILRTALISIILTGWTLGANAAEWIAKEYPASGFSEIFVGGQATIEIRQSDTEYVRAEAEPEVLERVEVDLTGNTLTLGVPSHSGRFFKWMGNSDEKVRFIVHVKSLSALNISGAVKADVGALTVSKFHLDGSGASHISMAGLTGENVAIQLSGASNVDINQIQAAQQSYDLSGAAKMTIEETSQADHITIDASGAAKMNAKKLNAKIAKLNTSGASSIDISVSDNLVAKADGASHINYYGKPVAEVDSSGASHINSRTLP
jgi:Putative auto-transporter adhesin, head GIN domain